MKKPYPPYSQRKPKLMCLTGQVPRACALLLLSSFANVAHADELPKRKSGLWEIQMSSGAHPATTMKQCVDASTDISMQQMAGELKSMCSKNEVTKTSSGYSLASECKMGASRISSQGTLTGDFDSSYKMEMVSTYDPPMMGMKETKTSMSARLVGPCAADQKPGDMVMPGGMKMNLSDLSKMKNMPPHQ